MFAKISFLALVLPLVHALQLSTPTNVASGGSVTITWTPAAGDPAVFSVYLVNTVFHDNFGVANNVQSSAGTLTLQLPIVPARDGYTLEAVDISNIANVYSTSGTFSITGESTTTTSTTSGTSTSTGKVPTTTAPPPTTSAFGSTVKPSGSTSSTGTGTSSGSATPSTGAASAMKFGFTSSNAGSFAAMLLSGVAGVVLTL